jgi:hypothetical protein
MHALRHRHLHGVEQLVEQRKSLRTEGSERLMQLRLRILREQDLRVVELLQR